MLQKYGTKCLNPTIKTKKFPFVLKIGDYELDTITLKSRKQLDRQFYPLAQVPDTLQGKVITVIEEGSEYNVSYSEIVRDDDTKTLYLTVTNELKTGNLTVSKTVLGEHADLEQNFEFTRNAFGYLCQWNVR